MNAPLAPADRLARATASYRQHPDDLRARTRLAIALGNNADHAGTEHVAAIGALVRDPRIDPAHFERAGWVALDLPDAANPAAAARWLEANEVALALLEETQVAETNAEATLSAIRRWLLLERQTSNFPRATAALVAQAAYNGGAWPFDGDERAALAGDPAFAPAYLPAPPPSHAVGTFADDVTVAVATQYTGWPYPIWQRPNALPPQPLRERLARLGPGAPVLPPDAQILVAGCGTGREAATVARSAPDAHVTAIDLSATSLAYARERCAHLPNLTFRQHDIDAVADLGMAFDYISTSGVLHCLPDPEAGWARLAACLKPGGSMRVALYSRAPRLAVAAARLKLGDLVNRPVTDDLIREARRMLIASPVARINNSRDFFSTAGLYDLLLHVNEEQYDVARMQREITGAGLDLLGFELPTPAIAATYAQAFPDDPWRRSYANWAAFELRYPETFSGMYRVDCLKPR